ncbi:peptidoglycan-binding domain-containing protein [Streptomyces sp. NPDC002776]
MPRAAVAAALTAAALIGFGGALLLPHDQDARPDSGAAPPPPPAASQPPAASVSAAPDPDGPRTPHEGDTGPEVTELQQRLLTVPDVYAPGPTTGRYDAGLTRAVARFQLWYGIRGDETGVPGDDTRLALESRTAAFGN